MLKSIYARDKLESFAALYIRDIWESIFGSPHIGVIQRNEKECITVCEEFQRAK
jgi:hypothetical protein